MLGIAPNWAPCVCNGIAHCLRPGGRFVTVNCSPALDFRVAPSYRKYGFDTSVAWTFFLEDGSFEIENYLLDVPIHEEAFRSAGFREIRWHGPLFLLTVRPPTVETSGQVSWPTLPLSSSSASSEKMNRGPTLRASCALLPRRVEWAAILLFRISTLVTHDDVKQLQSQLLRMK